MKRNCVEIVKHSGHRDSAVKIGERLVCDVVLDVLEDNLHLVHQDEISVCMRRCVKKVLQKHEILYNSFASRLSRSKEINEDMFLEIADELFQEGGVTWSRIIALYALAGRLALYRRTENNSLEVISRSMATCIASRIAPFVRKNGGWGKLCEEFPADEDVSNKIWMCLLVTGAGLGLAATLLARYMPTNASTISGTIGRLLL